MLKKLITAFLRRSVDTETTLRVHVEVLRAQGEANAFRMKELNEQIENLQKMAAQIKTQIDLSSEAIAHTNSILAGGKANGQA